jgi:DNA-binding beta-propeller fold protein YncE
MRRIGGLCLVLAALALPAHAAADGCVGRIGCPYTSVSSFALPVLGYSLAADAAGNLYVGNQAAAQVYRFTPGGSLNGNWSSSTGSSVFVGVAVTPNGGTIYAADSAGGQVLVFNGNAPNTSQTGTLAAGQLKEPWGLAFSGNSLEVADNGNRQVVELGPEGNVTNEAETLLPPNWPAVDPLGNIWAVSEPFGTNANEAPQAITELSPTFNQLDLGTLPLAALPGGAAIDSVGDLYVSDTVNDLILQYSAGGTLIDYFGGTGSAAGQFSAPLGIAIDSADNLDVIDSQNGRIERFALAAAAQAVPSAREAVVPGSRAPVTVDCLARGIPTCDGTLTLASRGKAVGHAKYSIPDDSSATVRVKLSKRARHRLDRGGTLRTRAYARTHSRAGEPDRVVAKTQLLRRAIHVCGTGTGHGKVCTGPPH